LLALMSLRYDWTALQACHWDIVIPLEQCYPVRGGRWHLLNFCMIQLNKMAQL
jgi:hypothetical protein